MSTATTTRPVVSPYLDDPERFASHLYSDLAAAGDVRITNPARSAFEAFEAAMQALKESRV